MTAWLVCVSASVRERVVSAAPDVTIDCVESPSELARAALAGSTLLLHDQSVEGLRHLLTGTLRGAGAQIAVLTDIPTVEQLVDLMRYDLCGYGHSHMSEPLMAQFLRSVLTGQRWFPPALLNEALAVVRDAMEAQRTAAELVAQLSPREREVAGDVANGFSNRDIALSRGVSEATVKTHLTRVFSKLNVDSRVALALLIRAASPKP